MTNLPGCSTTTPCIGFGVSLSHFCFQPVTDKRERGEGWGGLECVVPGEIRKMERKRENGSKRNYVVSVRARERERQK